MTTPPASSSPSAPVVVATRDDAPTPRVGGTARRPVDRGLARAILAHALLLGVAADLLLRDGLTGAGMPLWIALLGAGAISLAAHAQRALPRETMAWLATALGFSAAMAWRDAGSLQFLDFLATLFALGLAAVSLADRRSALLAQRLRDSLWAGAVVVGSVAVGVVALVLRDAGSPTGPDDPRSEPARRRLGPALRATLIALPLVLLFGALLRDADPVFASVLALPDLDLGDVLSHLVLTGFFAWVVAGWARAGLLADLAPGRAPERLPFGLGLLDVTVALGALDALFALYVATQLGWLFGGERFLQARTGLTAAQYAREGFFQMLWVAVLVVPLLLTTRAALRAGHALERRHTVLALPLLVLLGAMLLSAALRMRLYVQYYGLTLDRFYGLVAMGWLAVVLAWLSLTVLRGAGRFFAAGAVLTGLATLATLNVVVPDRIVARVNLSRAARGASLDQPHLAGLSGEALPLVVPALLAPPPPGEAAAADTARAERCRATRRMLERWGPTSRRVSRREAESAWRSWNRGEAEGRETVRASVGALRAAQHAACARAPAAGVTSAAGAVGTFATDGPAPAVRAVP